LRSQFQKLDVIFFGAHPDDVELNCGGTVLSLVSAGKKTGIIDLTLGELSTRGDLRTRKVETDAATKLLGIQLRNNLKISDGNIELNKINRLKVITEIRKHKPSVVFAPYPLDRHPDHIHTSDLISESFFYSGLSKIRTGSLEAYRPDKIFYYRNAYEMPVTFIYDISKTYSKKLKVLECYGTQFYNPLLNAPQTFISTKLFEKEVEARARHFGFKIGAEFGEEYFSHDAVKVNSEILFEI